MLAFFNQSYLIRSHMDFVQNFPSWANEWSGGAQFSLTHLPGEVKSKLIVSRPDQFWNHSDIFQIHLNLIEVAHDVVTLTALGILLSSLYATVKRRQHLCLCWDWRLKIFVLFQLTLSRCTMPIRMYCTSHLTWFPLTGVGAIPLGTGASFSCITTIDHCWQCHFQ